MQKFPSQGPNLCHSCYLSHSSDNALLSHQGVLIFFFFLFWLVLRDQIPATVVISASTPDPLTHCARAGLKLHPWRSRHAVNPVVPLGILGISSFIQRNTLPFKDLCVSISITWEFIRNAASLAPPQTYQI